nr:MAG TPA: hypothetical protein [Caudoviricetes sp.]
MKNIWLNWIFLSVDTSNNPISRRSLHDSF